MNVSNLPQGNFLAIDEGWGTMDSDNLNSVAATIPILEITISVYICSIPY